MHHYEARPLRPARGHSLNKEQKQEQLAILYGREPHDSFMDSPANFSPEQMEQMRAMLAAYDASNPRGESLKQFDLNNPPKTPYVYREFPRCMYHHQKGLTQNAHSHAQVAEMEAAGWSKDAFTPKPAEAEGIDAAEAEEIARLDATAKKKKAKA